MKVKDTQIIFKLYVLSTKTYLSVDGKLFFMPLSTKTYLSVDGKLFFMPLSTKLPLFVDEMSFLDLG